VTGREVEKLRSDSGGGVSGQETPLAGDGVGSGGMGMFKGEEMGNVQRSTFNFERSKRGSDSASIGQLGLVCFMSARARLFLVTPRAWGNEGRGVRARGMGRIVLGFMEEDEDDDEEEEGGAKMRV